MNIAILIDTIGAGGAERQAIMCVSELRKLGHSADLIYYHPKVEYVEVLEDLKLNPIYVQADSLFQRISKLRVLFKERNYHVVHGFKMAAEFYAAAAGIWAGIPNRFGSFRVLYTLGKKDRLYHFVVDKYLSGWIVNSKAIADSMARSTGIRRERIAVLYNGLISEKFHVSLSARQAKARIGLPEEAITVAMVARLEPQKNYRMLIDAAAIVYRQEPQSLFLIVGQGSMEKEIREYARALGLSEKIIFLGRRADIPEILAAVDISVLTSNTEGLPNTIIEAMAAGKPIVCTDYQGFEEIMTNEENAIISPCGNADKFAENILRLIRDEPLRRRISQNALQYAQKQFLPEIMAKNLEAIYLQYGRFKSNNHGSSERKNVKV
jgi:glycosyltransferase involved in cell wall biosynthesis